MQTIKGLAKSVERFRDEQAVGHALQKAVDKALERHKRLGESVAVWQNGKVVILTPEELPDVGR
jgi:hypothetical protein